MGNNLEHVGSCIRESLFTYDRMNVEPQIKTVIFERSSKKEGVSEHPTSKRNSYGTLLMLFVSHLLRRKPVKVNKKEGELGLHIWTK